jgi:hypothetical protein
MCRAITSILADRYGRQRRSGGRTGDALLIRQGEAEGLWGQAAVVTNYNQEDRLGHSREHRASRANVESLNRHPL